MATAKQAPEKQRYKRVLTVALAKEYLADLDARLAHYGLVKRSIKRSRVERLKRKMALGQFAWGISNISRAENLAILQGTHTLTALSEFEEGKPGTPTITIDVFENCPPEDFYKFDEQGSSRTLKEVLEIQGEMYPGEMAILLPRVKAFLDGTLNTFTVAKTATEDMLEVLEEHRDDLNEAVEFAMGATYREAMVSLMFFAAKRADALTPKVKAFLKGVKNGANLDEDSLALRLRGYLEKEGRDLREKKCIKVFFRCVNSVISGDDIKMFAPKSLNTTPLFIVTD
jgi:hypothetical protein